MSLHQTFRINTPAVVSEAFENEIVIIHLESGAYYSLDQSGAAIWQLLQQEVDLTEIRANLSAAYRTTPEEIAQVLPSFIDELMQEQLIVSTNTLAQPSNGAPTNTIVRNGCAGHAPFVRPVLQKFTDMQDLLLLDPIHDVNSSGWPMKK